jgi:hypothetical protein
MSQFDIATCRQRSLGGSKGALYRETLQATGFYVGRVVIATAEFAPMPPSVPGYPGGSFPTAVGMRFRRHDGIYQSDVGSLKPTRAGHCLPPMSRLEPENAPGGSRSRPSSR